MSKSVEDTKKLCHWLEYHKNKGDFPNILSALEQPQCFRSLWSNVGSQCYLFRCRPHKEHEIDLRFSHSSQLGYIRDKKIITDYGRCNVPEQAVLYLSENRDTSIIETLQNRNEHEVCTITIGIWQMQQTVNVLYVVQPDKNKRGHLYEKQLGERYDSHVLEQLEEHPDYKEFSDIYFDYMDRKFKSEKEKFSYLITAAYSNLTFTSKAQDTGTKSYGIMYRSITQTDFFNVAFSKEVEDEKMIVLKESFKLKLRVKRRNPKTFDDFDVLEIEKCQTIQEDGKIIW